MDYTSIKIIFLSYATAIIVGAFLLMAPFSHVGELSFTDALFTSASATCVTGLIVKNTAMDFTGIGQGVILVLIQIGGIGYMSVATLLFLLMRNRLEFQEKRLVREVLAYPTMENIGRFLKNVFLIAVFFEFIGSLLLTLHFHLDYPLHHAIWLGIFHSVSAFNNAGFSLFSDSLMGYRHDITVLLTLSSLVVLGGLGYFVLLELYLRKIRHSFRLSTHSKVTLIATGLLVFLGIVFFLSLEWNNPETFGGMKLYEKILNGIFLSVNFRTSGFNSIDIGAMGNSSLFFSTLFMMIGGGAGSTAGGIKVTTLAVLLLAAWYTVQENGQKPHLFGRSIAQTTINKALATLLAASLLVILSTIWLVEMEPVPFLPLLFEVISAFATVGLSVGNGDVLSLSAEFGDVGKSIIIALMLAGRLGILAFGIVLLGKAQTHHIEYPEGRIML